MTKIPSPQPAPRPLTAVKAFADSVLAMLDERIKAVDQAAHPFNDYFGDQPETIVAAKAQAGELREVRTQVRILGDRALVDLMKFKLAIPAPEGDEWKAGNEFLPYHPQASHVSPDFRAGWNSCYRAALAVQAPEGALRAAAQRVLDDCIPISNSLDGSDRHNGSLSELRTSLGAMPTSPPAKNPATTPGCGDFYPASAPASTEVNATADRLLDEYMTAFLRSDVAARNRARDAVRAAFANVQPKGMPAEWLDAFEEWRQTLGAADLDGKRDLVWRHIAGTGFQAGAAWARSQAPAPAQGSWVRAEDVQRLARDLDVAINGEAAAAPAPQLCDVVAQAIGIMDARRAEFPVVARWTKNAKDGAPRARVWVQFEDGGPEVEFASDLQAPAVGDGQ